ncbi:MAG: NAD(P)/FAD-dependent oxidoreductase [Anaerolineae bacterium]
MTDILIVGAGMSGLMAAGSLDDHGYDILIVDKGRSIGGRMATRWIGPGYADHGAQFFTVREAAFQKYVDRWQADGVVYIWGMGFSQSSTDPEPTDGHPRYVVQGGMNLLPKHIAKGFSERVRIRASVQANAVIQQDDGWLVTDESGETHTARALILTPPVPQTLALLDEGGVTLAADERAALDKIAYAPCLCGLFWVRGKVELPAPGAVQRPEATFTWIADNQRKGISPEATILTVHAGREWSQEHFDDDPQKTLEALWRAVQAECAGEPEMVESQLKKWRYSRPLTTYPARTLMAEGLPPLAFAGDAFGEPRVEGASLSGLAAADALHTALTG